MSTKRAIISVINDLVTDQRVDKTARALQELGYEVLMVGRHKHDSMRMDDRPYGVNRMRLLWEKGPLFYSEYNIRLFFLLLFQKADFLVSNDLDTLLPSYLIHKIKRIPLVFDSHEYFTETPEVINRPFVKNVWKKLEKMIVPRLKHCITVNASIADLFQKEYGIKFNVVRNIPAPKSIQNPKTRAELDLPSDRYILLLQGAGINIQRGAEELVEAMVHLDRHLLLIIGGGDVLPELKVKVTTLGLNEKVRFIPKQTPENLATYTRVADLGLTLDKDTNINYRFSLPNKLFDYIHAGIPILASPLPEIRKIIEQYQIGDFISSHDPLHIAEKIKEMLTHEERLQTWKVNLKHASEALTWDNEKKVLLGVLRNASS